MNPRLLLVPLFFVATLALAADPPKADEPKKDDDPIAADLRKDKEAFVEAQEKAKGDVLKAFVKYYETVKSNKALRIDAQLAQLEKIEAEKKASDEGGDPPTLPAMQTALTAYKAALKKAEAACKG